MDETTFSEKEIIYYPNDDNGGGGGCKPNIYDCNIQMIYEDNGTYITCKLRDTGHTVRIVTQMFEIKCIRIDDKNDDEDDKNIMFIFNNGDLIKVFDNGEEFEDVNSNISPKNILDKELMLYLKLIVKPKIQNMIRF